MVKVSVTCSTSSILPIRKFSKDSKRYTGKASTATILLVRLNCMNLCLPLSQFCCSNGRTRPRTISSSAVTRVVNGTRGGGENVV